ncbi:MAG: hypothetical protein KKI06_07560 [Euryarchaeota archaeon]|nr:hypothetical protein [Euryarchaeota archaeon]MBU4222378.1 hypothetical protein [Euryarchaeota archaeon]MCG2737546.1 hypothetical protein [Candidatus Methanoperedenaceae archaeon]
MYVKKRTCQWHGLITPKTMHENEKNEDSLKTNALVVSGLFFKIVSIAFSISAMILISLAIASPNGITYYEDVMLIKIIEILLSSLAILYLLNDLLKSLTESKL